MLASFQALGQFSQCRTVGRAHGSPRMLPLSLKELHSTHSSGTPTISAHSARMPWEKTLRTAPSAGLPAARRGARPVAAGRRPGAGPSAFRISSVSTDGLPWY